MKKGEWVKIIAHYVFAVTAVFLVVFFHQQPLLLTFLFILLSIATLMLERSKHELLMFVLVGIVGASSEILPIYVGTWTYANPHVLGIPYWLPFPWALAGLFVLRLSKHLNWLNQKYHFF